MGAWEGAEVEETGEMVGYSDNKAGEKVEGIIRH